MSAEMDALEAKIKANSDVEDSAIVAFQGLAVQIADAAGDRAKSLALASEVEAKAAALAAAIPAGTPAAPAP